MFCRLNAPEKVPYMYMNHALFFSHVINDGAGHLTTLTDYFLCLLYSSVVILKSCNVKFSNIGLFAWFPANAGESVGDNFDK